MNEIPAGNRPKEYAEDSPKLSVEQNHVRMWFVRIERAARLLEFEDRQKKALESDRYIEGTKQTRNAQKIYLNYLAPLLEDMHLRTLPGVPTAQVEAQTGAAQPFEDAAKELLNRQFSMERDRIKAIALQMQQDDDRCGGFIAKVEWLMTREKARPAEGLDEQTIALELEKAQVENMDPEGAGISADNLDFVHLNEHYTAMQGMMEEMPAYEALDRHAREHQARMVTVKAERPIMKRVGPWQYIYDPDVPWEDRGWEVELKSLKVADMVDQGYRNVNPANAPAEMLEGQAGDVPYVDRTVQVYVCHDRREHKRYIIAKEGPREGRFLKKDDWPYGEIDIYRLMCFRSHNPDKSWGLATNSLCAPILEELAQVDYDIQVHVKEHANYMTIWPKGHNTSDVKSAFNDPNQRHIDAPIEVIAGMKEHKPPPIPPTLLTRRGDLLNELRRVTSQSAQDSGEAYPGVISATESSNRGQATQDKKMTRQETMSTLLSWYGLTCLELYRAFGEIKVPVKTIQAQGVGFEDVDPAKIPSGLDVWFDVHAETDEARAEDIAKADRVVAHLAQSPSPIDWQKLDEWYLRKLDVKNPEQFRLEGIPQGQENVEGAPAAQGSPGQTIQFPQGGAKDYSPEGQTQTA